MAIGLGASLPCVILPWLLEHKADRSKPWFQKYWVKANVWIAIFSFIGNYFWTHYFYTVLGAEYTFPSWKLNEVFCQHYSLAFALPIRAFLNSLLDGAAGSDHIVLHDPCLLLLLPCALQRCAQKDESRCATVPARVSVADSCHCCVYSRIHHCSNGDSHHCTFPILQVQGNVCCSTLPSCN